MGQITEEQRRQIIDRLIEQDVTQALREGVPFDAAKIIKKYESLSNDSLVVLLPQEDEWTDYII